LTKENIWAFEETNSDRNFPEVYGLELKLHNNEKRFAFNGAEVKLFLDKWDSKLMVETKGIVVWVGFQRLLVVIKSNNQIVRHLNDIQSKPAMAIFTQNEIRSLIKNLPQNWLLPLTNSSMVFHKRQPTLKIHLK
jgi:hypothetical protein